MSVEKKEEKVLTSSVKCEGCGANMVFNPDTQTLYCPHCGSKKEFSKGGEAEELDIVGGFKKSASFSKSEKTVFRCVNCGAKVVLNNGETAKTCPFCGTAHVEKTEELSGLKPNALIPFLLGAETAADKVKEWAKKKLYAPRAFKKNVKAENLSGVYMPCFTFDSNTSSFYEGRIGIDHTRVVGSGKDSHTETWTEWRHISGAYNDRFDDVLITAGEKFDQKKLNKVSPFTTNASKKYDEKYMLGFSAYRYDYELTDCWGEAKKLIDKVIKRSILSRYHYDHLDYINISTKHENVTYKYVMLPVYVGNFNYSNKLYNFYVNGETGKIYGKTPKSPLKILLTVLIGLGVVGLIIWLILSGILG